jgi:signal transduction histidine kinase
MSFFIMKALIKERQKRIHYEGSPVFCCVESRDPGPRVPQRVALIDSRGNIVAVNKDWMALAEKTGNPLNRVGLGVNYLEVCREASGSCIDSRKALAGIHTVLKGKLSSFTMDYTCQADSGPAYLRMNVTPMAYKDARVAIAHADITDLQLSKERDCRRLQEFARRLINAQEGERQRIGREIHDDLGNRIALMSLSLRQFMKERPENQGASMRELNKILHGIADLSTALRNLSHQLHSPALHHLGVVAGLKSLQEAFEKTHGIRLDVSVPAVLPRLGDEVELCIFRISQECLQNVAKHSGADKARIVLEHTSKQVRLTVTDNGRGFDPAKAIQQGGLGLLSMEERALSLRGRLTVASSAHAGTEVRLTIPIQNSSVATVQ